MTQLDEIRTIKCTGNLTAGNKRESFHPFEIGMFDCEDALFCQKRFGVVVDQLAVYEHIDAMGGDGLHFLLHFFLQDEASTKLVRKIKCPSMSVLTRSARSSSASFPVLSTFTRAPKILILSVSIAESHDQHLGEKEHDLYDTHVLAMRILAFSSLLGQFTPIALSKMKPKTHEKRKNFREHTCLTFI